MLLGDPRVGLLCDGLLRTTIDRYGQICDLIVGEAYPLTSVVFDEVAELLPFSFRHGLLPIPLSLDHRHFSNRLPCQLMLDERDTKDDAR